MPWSDGGAWSSKTFAWDTLNLEIWDGSHGPWSDDVEAWNGFAAACAFSLGVALATPTYEVHQFGSLALGVQMAHAAAGEANAAPSVSFPLQVGKTVAGIANAATPVILSLEMAVPIAVEAHAAPSDVDDAWLVVDGAWNDAGGGPWDQLGGTPLRLTKILETVGGLDATEAVSIDLETSVLAGVEAHMIPSAEVNLELEQLSGAVATAEVAITAPVQVEVFSATSAHLVGLITLEIQPALDLFGGFLFDASVALTVAMDVLSERERLEIWTEDGSFDSGWLEDLALSTTWLGTPFQSALWTELAEANALWVEDASIDANWLGGALAGSSWSKTSQLSKSWQAGVGANTSWTKQTGIDKEWS